MRKITADWVYPITSSPVYQGVIVLDNQGKVLQIDHRNKYDPAELETHSGVLLPGFINTHCHLELSHLRAVCPTGTGLIAFIEDVITKRGFPPEQIQAAIRQADQAMYDNGIVAVGDISNTTDSFAVKSSSPIRYYTFVECFDMFQSANTQKIFDGYKAVYDALAPSPKDNKAMVPHAPYSVSPALYRLLHAVNTDVPCTISIHNEETPAENELFLQGSGAFFDFYNKLGLSTSELPQTNETSIHYALQRLDHRHRTLFVHNTLTTCQDIRAALQRNPHTFWATCPNANLYIENRLPSYKVFIEEGATMTIGTDSLTSNWQLSVLEELKTIKRYQSFIPSSLLFQWATLNGARALGWEQELGSISRGKTCGINLVQGLDAQLEITDYTTIQRLL